MNPTQLLTRCDWHLRSFEHLGAPDVMASISCGEAWRPRSIEIGEVKAIAKVEELLGYFTPWVMLDCWIVIQRIEENSKPVSIESIAHHVRPMGLIYRSVSGSCNLCAGLEIHQNGVQTVWNLFC